MIRVKYGAVIGREMCFLVRMCPGTISRLWVFFLPITAPCLTLVIKPRIIAKRQCRLQRLTPPKIALHPKRALSFSSELRRTKPNKHTWIPRIREEKKRRRRFQWNRPRPSCDIRSARRVTNFGRGQPLSFTLSFGDNPWFDIRGQIQRCDWSDNSLFCMRPVLICRLWVFFC